MKQRSGYGTYKRAGSARSRTSYSNGVSTNAQKKRRMVLNMDIKLLLVCLVIPPLGVYLLWAQDEPHLPVRIGGSIAACLIMYLWFMALLPGSTPTAYQFSKTTPAAVTEYATAQSE